jgi:hypothetical protein
MVRTNADPGTVLPAVREVVRELDPSVPISNAATMEELIDRSLQRPRSLSVLVARFAAVALVRVARSECGTGFASARGMMSTCSS